MAGTVISDLPDDLLRLILYFAPAKEGASTSVLSRRWRHLWASSGAVNLHWPAHKRGYTTKQWRNLFRVSEAALAAVHAHGPVRRLTFDTGFEIHNSGPNGFDDISIIVATLTNPAAQHVEELRFTIHEDRNGYYMLHLGPLPTEDLRILHIAKCKCLKLPLPPAGLTFPRLEVLRMEACTVFLKQLNPVLDAALRLATLHLERICLILVDAVEEDRAHDGSRTWSWSFRLRCPAVTTLVLEDCKWPSDVRMELDTPRLRYFRYKGFVPQLSLGSPAVNIAQLDLHFIKEVNIQGQEKMMMRSSFWHFLQNFNRASILKVKLDYLIEHIAVASKEDQNELLDSNKLFCNLEHLELEAPQVSSSKGTSVAMANLLYCCPNARDLCLKLTEATASRASVDQVDADNYEVSDRVPSFTEYLFNSLQSCLRRRVHSKFGLD